MCRETVRLVSILPWITLSYLSSEVGDTEADLSVWSMAWSYISLNFT